ncbi:Hypothetical predicted protein [Mytilus galloprovincialis]|uniref:Uncharacterized protein n=1 Tax=Mytilus galloprovincialis TaxID=29158 RepID=A0A8B6BY59_MYTGA|nr:Hypothetical predicted protein [Mytilus galloprovincialis]
MATTEVIVFKFGRHKMQKYGKYIKLPRPKLFLSYASRISSRVKAQGYKDLPADYEDFNKESSALSFEEDFLCDLNPWKLKLLKFMCISASVLKKIISALNEEILNLTKDEDVEDQILQTDEYKFFLNTKIRHIRKKCSNSPTLNITTLSNQSTENTNQRVEDPDKAIGQVHYIPHHPVKKDFTTTPIRIVYDCSCRQSRQLPSLNDCLLSTPPILNDLTTLLVRFRLNPVAIVTDIEKAFLHVGLHDEDRDVTRFLWLSDPKDPRSHLTTYRFKSVLFGATSQGDEKSITKRKILKESSKIYDPLGLLSPVSIRAKTLIQDLWIGGYDWDKLLPHALQSEWTRLAQAIETATKTTFSRHYFDESSESSEKVLHVFVHASLKAYEAVAYLNNEKDTSLVMAKTRVAPFKKLTLPQLELMAAVIGARLAHHLQTTLKCSNITLWSDSQIVLQWIKTTKTLKRFVSNRINEIKKLTDNCEWQYCPTNYNPADLLSRETNTAVSVLTDDDKEPLDDEESKTCENDIQFGIDRIIDINNYGSYKKLLRVSAFVQRFIHNCRTVKSLRNVGAMTPDELQQSTILWIRCCQAIAYQDEVRALKLKQIQKTKLPRLRQLQLYLDNNDLMRCKGRIHNAPIPESANYLYLLPPNH